MIKNLQFKVLSAIVAVLFYSLTSFGQTYLNTDFENWTGDSLNGWKLTPDLTDLTFSQGVDLGRTGDALQITANTNNSGADGTFETNITDIVAGNSYNISCWVKSADDKIWVRFWGLRWYDASDTQIGTDSNAVAYNALTANAWTQYTMDGSPLLAPAGAVKLRVSIRAYIQSGFTSGTSTILVDDFVVSTTGGTTTPSLTISSPVNASTVTTADVNVTFSVANFTVGVVGSGADGHIQYIVDAGTAQQQYTTAAIALTGLTDASHTVTMELVDDANASLSPAVTATVTFTVNTAAPSTITIHDIQYTTDASGDSPYKTQIVTTSGIVTGIIASKGFYIQDGVGAWNGLYIYDLGANVVGIGNDVTVTGTIDEYFNLTEMKSVTSVLTLTSGNSLPAVTDITTGLVDKEQYEGVLVRFTSATCTNVNVDAPNSFGVWEVNDGTGAGFVHVAAALAFTPTLDAVYTLTGNLDYSFSRFKIEVGDANNISVGINNINNNHNAVNLFPNPANNFINLTNLANAQKISIANAIGQTVREINVNAENMQLNISDLHSGVYFILINNQNGSVQTKYFVKE